MTDGSTGPGEEHAAALADPARLAVLARTGLFREHAQPPGDGVFDKLARFATLFVRTPMALVSLLSDREQIHLGKAGFGTEGRRSSLEHSLCPSVISAGQAFVVANTNALPEFKAQHESMGNPIAAYCGVPLRAEGAVVGSVCVMDTVPREWAEDEIAILRDLATLAERELSWHIQRGHEELIPPRLLPVLDSVPAAVYAANADGRLVYHNTRAAKLWGNSPTRGALEAEAFAIRRPSWPDGSPVPLDETPLQIALRTGKPAPPVELRIGTEHDAIVALVSAEPLFTADGELIGALGVLQDVTAERKAQLLRDELLALVSHEIRTPLTVISGTAAFLARHGSPENLKARTEVAQELIVASRRMERVVENVLQLTLLDHEHVNPEPVLAQVLVDKAIRAVSADFPQISIAQSGDTAAVSLAVENWAVLALTNLLHNAVQYGDPSEVPHIDVVVNGMEIEFRVSNLGPVFTAEEFSALFAAAYRRPEVRERVPGAGLGLTTARNLARAQGGSLFAGLRPDQQGPMFTLALPVYASGESEPA